MIDAFTAINFARFIITSNNEWAAPVSESGRRDVAFKFADFADDEAKAERRKLIEDMIKEMNNGGFSALMRDLLAIDLDAPDAPNLRVPLMTAGLIEQKDHSMSLLDRSIRDLLDKGVLETPYDDGFGGPNCAPLDALTDYYREYVKSAGDHSRRADETLAGLRWQDFRRQPRAAKTGLDDPFDV